MGNWAWKYWVIAPILAVAQWAASSSKAEEKAQPKAFNSAVAFRVYAVVGEERQFVGITPSERPLTIPPCRWWFVEPRRPVDMEKVCQEVEAQRIPGLKLREATDADLEHLKRLTALQDLNLAGTRVTDAGLQNLKGLTALQRLNLQLTQVSDAGLVHLEGLTALQSLELWNTKVTDAGLVHLKGLTGLHYLGLKDTKVTEAGVEQLQKSLPNVEIIRQRAAKRAKLQNVSARVTSCARLACPGVGLRYILERQVWQRCERTRHVEQAGVVVDVHGEVEGRTAHGSLGSPGHAILAEVGGEGVTDPGRRGS